MKKWFIRLTSLISCAALLMVGTASVFAAEQHSREQQVEIDGILYTIEITEYDGMRVVHVTDGETSVVTTFDSEWLSVYSEDGTVKISVEKLEQAEGQPSAHAETWGTITTEYWDYYYYYSDANLDRNGMYFSFRCGEKAWAGYVGEDTAALDLARDLCAAMRELNAAQRTAAASAGTDSSHVETAEWAIARNEALDCDQLFLQFKQAL